MSQLSGFGDEIAKEIRTQADVMSGLDMHYIELRSAEGKGVLDLDEEDRAYVKEVLRDADIAVSAIGSPIGKVPVTDPFEAELARFERALIAAEDFETPFIRVFSYFIPEGEDPLSYEAEVIERMAEKARRAQARDIILLHENESRIFGESPENCLRLLEGVSSPSLRAIFDPSNFLQHQHVTYPDAWEMLRDHVVYFHIKDHSAEQGRTVPAGEGDGGMVEMFRDAAVRGFDGFLSLEPHLSSGPYEPLSGEERFTMAAKACRKAAAEAGLSLSSH